MRINVDLLDLRAFLAILDLKSFNKAAKALNLSQPALSRRIQALEASIGAPLIERSARHAAPTLVGRSLQPVIRRMIEEFEGALQSLADFDGRQYRQVTIASVPTASFYFLPQMIERYRFKDPRVRFRILDLSASAVIDSVASGEAEFGINLAGTSMHDLNFTPILEDPFVLTCREDHALARRRVVKWKDLERIPLIGVSRNSGNRFILDGALARHKLKLTFFYEVNHVSTLIGLVERGLGASVLPKLGAPRSDHPHLVTRPIGDPEVTRTIGLLERRTTRLSPAAQRFRDMLIENWAQ